MSVFFAGRLWVSPAVMSTIDDTAMADQGISVGNVLAIVGRSAGGEPNKALRFGSPSEARATLREGELLTAVLRAFDPSAQTGGPAMVIAMRVNPAVRSTLALRNAAGATTINLESTDFGIYTNQISVKVEPGSVSGLRLTTQLDRELFTADNIGRRAFTIRHSGAQLTATMTVTDTAVTLHAPAGTAVRTIDLNIARNVRQLVDQINSVPGFMASVLDGNDNTPALMGLDHVSAADVRTADFIASANTQAVADWFNGHGEGLVNAVRVAGVGTPPAPLARTFLSGGSDGVVSMTHWSDAYTALQAEDVQWVVPLSADPAIHAMNDAHCAFMSNVGRKERRGIVGMGTGVTDAAAIAAARALNSDRTSLVHLGFWDFDEITGKLVLRPAFILAALLAGAFSGVNPGTPLTNRSIKVRGLERHLRNPTDTDLLINGGVFAVESTPTGYRVVRSITTWLINDNFNRVEVSTGVAVDFTARNVRNALTALKGERASPIAISRAISMTESVLRELSIPEPQGVGVLVGDAASPPFRNIRASIEGDVLRVEFQASPAIPVNFIPITIFAVPFRGAAAA